MDSNNVKLCIMEPIRYAGDAISCLFKETSGVTIRGNLSNFSALELFLTLNGDEIDILLCDIYDSETNIINGLNIIRNIKIRYPSITIIAHTEFPFLKLLAKLGIDHILKQDSDMATYRKSALQIIRRNLIKNHSFLVKRMITDEEWEVFLLLSQHMSLKQIAAYLRIEYRFASKRKVSLMKKLGLKNNIHLLSLIVVLNRFAISRKEVEELSYIVNSSRQLQ